MSAFPERLRLYGGRVTHAARPLNGVATDLVTACSYLVGPKSHRKPGDAPVTCAACLRQIAKQVAE